MSAQATVDSEALVSTVIDGTNYFFPKYFLKRFSEIPTLTSENKGDVIKAWTAEFGTAADIFASRDTLNNPADPRGTAAFEKAMIAVVPAQMINVSDEEKEEDSELKEQLTQVTNSFESKFKTDADTWFGFKRVKGNPEASNLGNITFIDGDADMNKKIFPRIADGMRPVMFLGPTGTGKTLTARYAAQEMGLGTELFPHTAHTEVVDILGSWVPNEDGRLTFVRGPLVKAYEEGLMFIADEVTVLKAGVASVYNQVANNDALLVSTKGDGYIAKRHPNFRLIFTGNPPSYEGVNQFNNAQLNRPWLFPVWYPSPEKEEKILRVNYPQIPKVDIKRIVLFANDTRNKYKQDPDTKYIVSTRDTAKIAEAMTQYGESLRDAVEVAVLNVVEQIDTEEYNAVKKLYENMFPVEQAKSQAEQATSKPQPTMQATTASVSRPTSGFQIP